MKEIDIKDIYGNLETIEHMAQIGMILVEIDKLEHIPSVLEVILQHIQHLVMEYAAEGEDDGKQ